MLSYKRSATVTFYILCGCTAVFAALIVGAPFIMPFLEKLGHGTGTEYAVFLTAFYLLRFFFDQRSIISTLLLYLFFDQRSIIFTCPMNKMIDFEIK